MSANEPVMHSLIRNSFVFVPSAGMRLAPEVLVLELFRETFFRSHYEATGGADLDPDRLSGDGTYAYGTEERAVLHALRGRRRRTKNSKLQPFFAPAYPHLARHAWLGKKRERVVANYLLGGAISQHLWYKGETEDKKREQSAIVKDLVDALIGHNSYRDEPRGKEILSVALGRVPASGYEERGRENLIQKTGPSDTVMDLDDPLSHRIVNDLRALCGLEERIPRLQWLKTLMTFLRFAMPVWLLAHMRVTSLLHGWLIDAVDRGSLASLQDIELAITRRNRGLLCPTLTPTREIFERIESYVRHRVQVNLLLYCLECVRKAEIRNKRLKIRGLSSEVLTVDRLLMLARDATTDMKSHQWFRNVARDGRFEQFLVREAERSPAWRDPLKKGQGKNIDEFFRVLYRDDVGDEAGGYLLIPEGRGHGRGFRVFPGQLLLKTVTFLAAHDRRTSSGTRGGGKLVLADIEEHFRQYGVDFSHAADARPLLMRELQAMGLLTGSPDAGSSVTVTCPY